MQQLPLSTIPYFLRSLKQIEENDPNMKVTIINIVKFYQKLMIYKMILFQLKKN